MKTAKLLIPFLFIAVFLSLAYLGGLFRLKQEQLTDLLFSAKPPESSIVIVEIDDQSINKIGQWPWPRSVFAELIRKLEGASVIGIDVNFKEPSRLGNMDDKILSDSISQSSAPVILTAELTPGNSFSPPLEILKDKAVFGFPNLIISADGTARKFRPEARRLKSFALETASHHQPDVYYEPAPEIRINFLGPNRTFSYFSAEELLSGKIPRQFFEKKIVLIGATAGDLQDFHQTPFGIMSGVEIQANAVATLLGHNFFYNYRALDIAMIFAMSIAAAYAIFKSKKSVSMYLWLLAAAAAYNLSAFAAFDNFLAMDLFYPNLALAISSGGGVTARYFATSREKKFIQNTFSRYLAPSIVEQLIADPDKIKLGGEQKRLTIFFSDIRGFTAISEKMTPTNLTHFLNDYLTAMTDIVLKHGGVVDKYIGDAIMAFWGAPLDDPDHALKGMLAAIDMIDALKELNRTNAASGLPHINIGIGLHTGEVLIGNLGSKQRFDYTVIGDSVNLASRLESLNKTFGTNIIASQTVIEEIGRDKLEKNKIAYREIDEVTVKGKTEPVKIFEISKA